VSNTLSGTTPSQLGSPTSVLSGGWGDDVGWWSENAAEASFVAFGIAGGDPFSHARSSTIGV
jgi:hypothetical protein